MSSSYRTNTLMEVIQSISGLHPLKALWREQAVAFVPTMGALHAGHLALITHAKTIADKVVVSIFVNPLQFGPEEDLARYPRPLEQDLALCQEHGVDAVFVPEASELYPQGMQNLTHVLPPIQLTMAFCGLSRPGHFAGVSTVVLKLFNLLQPDSAVFGEKDAQQLAVIRQMVSDLNLPVQIISVPTVRESDGLALSSRNQYLKTASDRQQARLLSRLLIAVQSLYQQGLEVTENVLAYAQEQVLDETLYPDFELEYLAIVNNETFQPVEILDSQSRIIVAARVGNVRLIDNAMATQPLVLPTTPALPLTGEKTA